MSIFWAQWRCVGMEEKKDRCFADWVRHAPVNNLDRFAGPSLAACAQVKSQKNITKDCERLGMAWRKSVGPRNSATTGSPEKLQLCTKSKKSRCYRERTAALLCTTEPRNELLSRSGDTVSK